MTDARLVAIGDHRINVLSHGEGDRHFTCLHGLVDTLGIWKRLAPHLEARGRVTRIDQRGHGATPAPPGPYSRADLAADVYPDRIAGLVLIGTTSECREKVAGWYERIALAGEEDGNAGLARAIYGEKSAKEIEGDAQGIAHVTRMLKSLYTDPLTPKLSDVRCPALMTVGEKDPMGPKASEIVHAAMPTGRAALLRVPGKGHWLQLEALEAIVATLDAWLDEFEL
jgi:3-oxoadipate enol-lactonase